MSSTQDIEQAEEVHKHSAKTPEAPIQSDHVQHNDDLENAKTTMIVVDSNLTSGAARAEAMQLVWGKHGRLIVWLGISMMLIV